jgi:hypothetical protein
VTTQNVELMEKVSELTTTDAAQDLTIAELQTENTSL